MKSPLLAVRAYLTPTEVETIDKARTPRESRSAFVAEACRREVERRQGKS